MKVPKVDADGNELGGVPTVLRDAPLGTYLGWNITTTGFHAGQVCNYVGGMIPFAHTQAERMANGDPRLSLQERYGSHNGYVLAVKNAAGNAWRQGYLLPQDMINLVSSGAGEQRLRERRIQAELRSSRALRKGAEHCGVARNDLAVVGQTAAPAAVLLCLRLRSVSDTSVQ